MKPGQIIARKKWILGDRKMKINPNSGRAFWLHQRGYEKGDIRCARCQKFIDPTGIRFPEELKEIRIGKAGKKTHHFMFCRIRGKGSSAFITVPRHSPSRRKRVLEAKRY